MSGGPAASPTYVKEDFPSEKVPRVSLVHMYRRMSHIPRSGTCTEEVVQLMLMIT
jgi:hypothetical protein